MNESTNPTENQGDQAQQDQAQRSPHASEHHGENREQVIARDEAAAAAAAAATPAPQTTTMAQAALSGKTTLYGQPLQPTFDFEGSSFAVPAALVAPTDGLPLHFVTAPDIDGACRFDFVDAKNAELGNPPDAVQLYIWLDGVQQAFPDAPVDLITKMQANAHPANHPFGAPFWQGYRLNDKLPSNGNYDQSGRRILPNTLSCINGLTLEKFKELIAAQTKDNYNKTPFSLATATMHRQG